MLITENDDEDYCVKYANSVEMNNYLNSTEEYLRNRQIIVIIYFFYKQKNISKSDVSLLIGAGKRT